MTNAASDNSQRSSIFETQQIHLRGLQGQPQQTGRRSLRAAFFVEHMLWVLSVYLAGSMIVRMAGTMSAVRTTR